MKIDSSVYADAEIRANLDTASLKTGCARSSLIVAVMRRFRTLHDKQPAVATRVRNQMKNPLLDRGCMHVTLIERDYEMFLDMRKFFKMSVSLMVACAVVLFLEETIESILNDGDKRYTDNNLYINYIILRYSDRSSVSWQIHWGIPEKLNL